MAGQKLHIHVYLNGEFKGYVKSVSYARRKFEITANVEEAKGYVRESILQGDIDACAAFGGMLGYIFTY